MRKAPRFALVFILGISLPSPFAARVPRPAPGRVDHRPPEVELRVTANPAPRYVFEAEARDASGIAQVALAIDGRVIDTRIHEPWLFGGYFPNLPTPFEVCAQAEDRAGNSGADCQVITGPDACQTNTDCSPEKYCYWPAFRCEGPGACRDRPGCSCPFVGCPISEVCGCDGRTYLRDCDAGAEGVNVAHLGSCEPDISGPTR